MAPKSKATALHSKPSESRIGNDTDSQQSKGSSSNLSVISETSSMLVGSVASAAAKAPLKSSKVIVRDRKLVFWTPVMIWPAGFAKVHKKETI